MLDAGLISTTSTLTTITRLTDFLVSIITGQLGLVVNHIQAVSFTRDLNSCPRISRISSVIATSVKNTSRRGSDVEKEVAFNFIKAVLHADIVSASSTCTTITRLADLLISVITCQTGLIVNHIKAISHCGCFCWL